ncbi:metallophosphoesterase family protein [Roseiconus lacunae]|uniref:metallophosphoesterase family protein n=1 Tax=Roseiconus lacunae TaxID=2605694 RepID=UPI001E44040D|nr:metallophosphoesterase family protein [Roseiconus lacunae]MCD0460142.1 serine/threonine protein phosphatase [Roseiconus lacunae]
MRTLAIGDIHGCYRSLDTLASFAAISSGDRVITLGDYVDRGPDTRRVIDWLIDRQAREGLIPLRGNHEIMLLEARQSQQCLKDWLTCGGDAVLSSYGTDRLDGIPNDHWHFLESCLRSHYTSESHFFVHANADAEVPIDEQPDYMLYWESFGNPRPHRSGLTMICGHTAQRSGVPCSVGHAVCIDTWAYGQGWLTCLDVHSGICWQSNESGATRRFWIDEVPQ